ncbi:MAG: DUF72 domain-containing protein [Bacteroidota bacterium]|nr:DUF72 domain-containing protein [Bacteroidota bacterium]
MKFGRQHDPITLTETLPPDKWWFNAKTNKCSLFIGTTNWTNPGWKDPNFKTRDSLTSYSQLFNAIELNTSFYHIPSIEQVQIWAQKTAPNFKFCPKIPRAISHHKSLNIESDILLRFRENISNFESQLGPCFMQLPDYFDTKRKNSLFQFLELQKKGFNLFIELRHPSWFEKSQELDQLISTLITKNIGLVITDTPGRRDVLHMNHIIPTTFIRFVATGDDSSDESRLMQWRKHMEDWASLGVQEIYFFIHHPNHTKLIEFSKLLRTEPVE